MGTTDTLIINRILGAAAERKASDLHFSAGNYPSLRVDGKLINLDNEEVVTPDFIQQLLTFFLSENQFKDLQVKKHSTIIYEWMNQLRLKIKIFYQKGLPVLSIHLIPEIIPELNTLGLPHNIDKLTGLSKGLVLVGGTFGSGRSTTMAALLNFINSQRSENIVTIESPIEFLLANNKSIISQREVGKDVDSVEDALKQALDQDIDVLLVSNVETYEEWDLVLRHAEAGRLVFVIMTAETSTLALERIISVYPSNKRDWIRELIVNNLEAVLVQRLLPRVGGGLAMAVELLLINQAVAGSIKEDKLYQIFSILQSNREVGMLALDISLLELVRTGEVAKEDALPEVIDKVNFENNLKKF
jgi:twitching motility protein PilT